MFATGRWHLAIGECTRVVFVKILVLVENRVDLGHELAVLGAERA